MRDEMGCGKTAAYGERVATLLQHRERKKYDAEIASNEVRFTVKLNVDGQTKVVDVKRFQLTLVTT